MITRRATNSDTIPQARVLIALGTNGSTDCMQNIEVLYKALHALSAHFSLKVGRLYKTPAFPNPDDPDYVNTAALIETDLSPESVLDVLHHIENEFGRIRSYRFAPRVLDLDLLAYGDLVLPSRDVWMQWYALTPEEILTKIPDSLICPHPRLHERAFVLAPLKDVAPGWCHPILHKTAMELWEKLPHEARKKAIPILSNRDY